MSDDLTREPERIGDYRILGVLGEGGQSVVYRALHPRLATEVALKRLRADACENAALMKESLFLSASRHSALPVPLDFEVIDGATYLSMELIHGESLSQCCCRLTIAEICGIAKQLTAAISELHESQILHLDLSPANVLLDENGRCRLIDFGLSRRSPSAGGSDADVGIIGGTPGFAAPEVFRWPQVIDQRADVYGLGALVEYLLKARSAARRRASCTSRLQAVCFRALASDPAQRFNSAADMLAALDQIDQRSRSRRWLMVATVAASLVLGANRDLIGHVEADIFVGDGSRLRSLTSAPGVKRGDHIAFSFDWQGDSAGLAVRTPSGRVVLMKPFIRSSERRFRYPPQGSTILRQQSGTYVAYFAPSMDFQDDASGALLEAIDRLPPPPQLHRGEHVFSIAGSSEVFAGEGVSDSHSVWNRSVAQCRQAFPGFSAIAFHVD